MFQGFGGNLHAQLRGIDRERYLRLKSVAHLVGQGFAEGVHVLLLHLIGLRQALLQFRELLDMACKGMERLYTGQ